MNSPEKVADQVLGTPLKVVQDFLIDCVNLPDPLATIVPIRNTPYARSETAIRPELPSGFGQMPASLSLLPTTKIFWKAV